MATELEERNAEAITQTLFEYNEKFNAMQEQINRQSLQITNLQTQLDGLRQQVMQTLAGQYGSGPTSPS